MVYRIHQAPNDQTYTRHLVCFRSDTKQHLFVLWSLQDFGFLWVAPLQDWIPIAKKLDSSPYTALGGVFDAVGQPAVGASCDPATKVCPGDADADAGEGGCLLLGDEADADEEAGGEREQDPIDVVGRRRCGGRAGDPLRLGFGAAGIRGLAPPSSLWIHGARDGSVVVVAGSGNRTEIRQVAPLPPCSIWGRGKGDKVRG